MTRSQSTVSSQEEGGSNHQQEQHVDSNNKHEEEKYTDQQSSSSIETTTQPTTTTTNEDDTSNTSGEEGGIDIDQIIIFDEDGTQKQTTLEELKNDKKFSKLVPEIVKAKLEELVAEQKHSTTQNSPITHINADMFEVSSLMKNEQEIDSRVKFLMLRGFKDNSVKVTIPTTTSAETTDGIAPEQQLEQRKNEIRAKYLAQKPIRLAERVRKLHKELVKAKELIGDAPYVETNITKAIDLYREIAKQYPDDSLSLFNIGVIYETNKFGKFDYVLSKQYSLLAAMKGNQIAQFTAGYLYGNKLVTTADVAAVRGLIEELYFSQSADDTESTEVNNEGEVSDEILEQQIIAAIDKEELAELQKNNRILHEQLSSQIVNLDSDALAIAYYFPSALSGNFKSLIALGYRHLYGYGVPKSCTTAAYYYQQAAQQVKSEFEEGMIPMIEKVRLTDDVAREQKQNQDDVMEYYQYSADKGSTSSQLIVGYAHMYGLRGFARNGELARQFFQRAADAGEPEAYAALGNMYWKGIGVVQSNETAYNLFRKGAEKGDAASQYGLGSMHLKGAIPPPPVEENVEQPATEAANTAEGTSEPKPVPEQKPLVQTGFTLVKDAKLAASYFNMSANQGNLDAQYKLGVLYMTGIGVEQNYLQAIKYLSQAAQQGQTLARYHLGVLHKDGLGTPKNCNAAVKFFKHVVERAAWLGVVDQAFENYSSGKDYHSALSTYQQCAELGVEVAQSNAAYMFDRGYGVKHFLGNESTNTEQLRRALELYKKAAEQGNVEAYVKVGDYYYYGTAGLTNAVAHSSVQNTTVEYEKSVYNYRRAADLRNAQAMFNLGIMHEHGIGLPQDFHLAKRYYDMAAETDPVAVVPVYLALGKLFAHWGFAIARDYIKTTFGSKAGIITSETPLATASVSSYLNIFTSLLANRLSSVSEFFRTLSWEKLLQLAVQYEDRLLALLIGLLLFLMFVRHIYVNNMNEQRARLQRQQQQLQQQQEEEQAAEREEQPQAL